jgi:hypothetical protein
MRPTAYACDVTPGANPQAISNSIVSTVVMGSVQALLVETHLFTAGGHGFGLPGPAGEPARHWPELFAAWARAQGLG